MIMFKYNTKVHKANSKSITLQSSIPKEIAKLLDLSAGDEVSWNVEVINPEEFKICVTKKEE